MKKILLSIVAFLLCNNVFAQVLPGLDPVFANNGIYVGDTGSFGKILTQADSKIIAIGGGKAHAMRFDVNGTVDNSFANNGYFSINQYSSYYFSLYSICLQPDGKIILGGKVIMPNDNLFLMRINSQGEPDSSFGINGISITGYPGDEYISSIALQGDGKIVSTGIRQTPEEAIQIVRYQPDGRLDSSFGNNGEVYYSWTWGYFHYPTANDVAVLPDGRIVVGATTKIDANGKYCFTVLRLLSDGSPDTSFNHTGLAYADVGSLLAYCKAMRVQPDGKIVLTGHSDSITIVRFDTVGKLDNSFGNNGIVRLSPGSGTTLILQSDGKILVGGSAADTVFLLYRLLPNGTKDNSFGIGGSITTKILNEKNRVNGLALQGNGKIVACGESEDLPWPNNYSKAIMVRYLPNAHRCGRSAGKYKPLQHLP